MHIFYLNTVKPNLIASLCIILLFHKGVVVTTSSDLLAHLDMMLILKSIFMRRGVSTASNGLKIFGGGSVSLSSPSSILFLQQQQCRSSTLVASGGCGNRFLGNIWSKTTSSFSLVPLFGWLTGLDEAIWNIKRTYQPSVVKRKRKHGLIARLTDRHGRKVLQRRLRKKRTRIVTCL